MSTNGNQIWTREIAALVYGEDTVAGLYRDTGKESLPASVVSQYVSINNRTPKSVRCPRCNKASSLVDESNCLSCGWPKYLGSKKKNVKA